MKKVLSLMLTAMLLLGTMTACGSPSASAPINPEAGNSPALEEDGTDSIGDENTIRFVMWSDTCWDGFQAMEKDFNEKHPEYNLEIEMNSTYWEFINARLAANNLPDVFDLQPGNRTWSMAREGLLYDLSDQKFVDMLSDSVKSTISYEDKVYAFPMAVCYLGIFYNKDIFEQAGIESPPQTLSEFREACEKIKALGIAPVAVSHNTQWTIHHELTAMIGTALDEKMPDFVEAMNSGEGSYADWPEVNNALELFDMMCKEYTIDKPMDSDYSNKIAQFAQGNAAMYVNGSWTVMDVMAINPDLRFGVFAFPLSEDPEDCKMTWEAEFCQASPANVRNPDAIRVFYDYLVEQDGGLYNVAELQGRIPAIDYPMPSEKLSDTFEDGMAIVNAGKTVPWLLYQMPFGTEDADWPVVQDYVNGKMTREELLSKLDYEWISRNDF